MKKAYRIFCILFLALLFGSGVLTVARPGESFSELENRQLKKTSDISSDVMSGQFQSDLEKMLSDQFPLRYLCVTLQTKLKLAAGKKDIGGAYIGEGRLFQKITSADISCDDIASHAARYARAGERAGVKVVALPVPSAGCSIPDLLPKGAEMYDFDRAFAAIAEKLGRENVIDVSGALAGDPKRYYTTDHHWTEFGACDAYLAWSVYHGFTRDEISVPPVKTVSEDFRGTLCAKVPGFGIESDILKIPDIPFDPKVTADGREIPFYDLDALKTRDKYRVFLGGNHGITVIENPDAAADRTVLIVKDSFANSFVPYLVRHYKKIVMVDERYATVDLATLALSEGADEIAIIKEAAFF